MITSFILVLQIIFGGLDITIATAREQETSYNVPDRLNMKEFAIGFSHLTVRRTSDSWEPGASEKPVNGWYWYPIAESEAQEPLRYKNFANLLNTTKSSGDNVASFHRIINGFAEDTLSFETIENYLNQSSSVSYTNKKPSEGLPLVVLSGAHPIYFLEMAERLVQSGYVVISVPRTGMKRGERLPYTVEGVREYANDLDAILDYLSEKEMADLTRVGFVSWSFDGIATLDVAVNRKTKCFLSLDSALGYTYGTPLIDTLLFERELPFQVIHYTGSAMNHGKYLEQLEGYPDQVSLIRDYDISHGSFTSIKSMTTDRLLYGSPNPIYLTLIENIRLRLKLAFKS